jgi:hypothetical protein
MELSAVLSPARKQISSALLISILIHLALILNLVPAFISIIDAQTLQTLIPDEKKEIINDTLQNGSEYRINDESIGTIRPPFISPNPVGPSGQVNITANEADSGEVIESMIVNIKGPNIGSTNPLLSPSTIGSVTMHLKSNATQGGLWTGNFAFPSELPDGNYVYSLTTRDRTGHERTTSLFSGIILDRNLPDAPETNLVSAMDSDGKTVSNGGITISPNITFSFEGSDKTGVMQNFECNLDDIVIRTEHDHGEDPGQIPPTYFTCVAPTTIAAQAAGNHSYTDLSPGNHTFKVRAIDNEYDVDSSPSIFSWSILPPPR